MEQQNAATRTAEEKYKLQAKGMLESHQQLQSDLQQKSRRLEEECRRLKEETVVLKREREVEAQQTNFRMQELQKSEETMRQQLDEAREDKESKLGEWQKQADKDREVLKQRVQLAEKKAKEAEAKRSQNIFDIEKEKARWQMELDSLRAQKRDQDDIILNLERRKDLLFKENERLKSEWRASRSSVERTSVGSGSGALQQKLAVGISSAMQNANKSSLTFSTNRSLLGGPRGANAPTSLSKKGGLGAGLRVSGQQNLPPQPQKLGLQPLQQANNRYQ